jgi:hypothetical protein
LFGGGPKWLAASTPLPHFHIRWLDKEKLDWECFATRDEATERATDLALPGEAFTIEEIHTKCPLLEKIASAGKRLSNFGI